MVSQDRPAVVQLCFLYDLHAVFVGLALLCFIIELNWIFVFLPCVTKWIKSCLLLCFGTFKMPILMFISILVFRPEGQEASAWPSG